MKSRTSHRKDLVAALPEPPRLVQRELAFDQWVDYGKQLKEYEAMIQNRVENYQMLVGAWYNYGVEHWQRPADRAAKQLGYSAETIHNWAWVERRVPSSLRGDGYSFEDYRAVAALPKESERRVWLEKKKQNEWSASELRRQVAQARGNKVTPRTLDEREADRRDALAKLIDALVADGDALLKNDDELSRVCGDVYLDCANRIREAIGR